MPVAEVAIRLVIVKDVLPSCDAVFLIERHPQIFLAGDAEDMRTRISTSYRKLCEYLEGAAVSRVIEYDPELLVLDSLDHGELLLSCTMLSSVHIARFSIFESCRLVHHTSVLFPASFVHRPRAA